MFTLTYLKAINQKYNYANAKSDLNLNVKFMIIEKEIKRIDRDYRDSKEWV